MEIQIFGGINEIGGNKIFINVGDKTFLFDFGLSFKDYNKFFSEFLSPRKFNGIVDYLYLKLIPPINELYRNDLILPFADTLDKKPYNIKCCETNYIDAFFLTHAHMDHYKFVSFLKKETPIYLNWISKAILFYISTISNDPLISDVLSYYELFKTIPKMSKKNNLEKQYKRAKKREYDQNEIKRNIVDMEIEKPYSFNSSNGTVSITQYEIDHSIPGACSYIIEHDGRSIIYTGDFRRHGFHDNWIDTFINIARRSNPLAIITEGTKIPSKRELNDNIYSLKEQSERDVLLKSGELIKSHLGLILLNFPARNLDRILIYYELAKKNHRTFAITPKIFLFLQSIRSYFEKLNENEKKQFKGDYKLPETNSENIIVYLPRRSWGKFELIDYKKFEKKIFKEKNYVTYKEVKNEPEKYLLYLDFFMLNELIDLDQKPGTVMYLNSTTDPFSEEMELQEDKLNAWLERFGIFKTETVHSSGHCSVKDLIETLQKINADYIIPVHTENHESIKDLGFKGNIILPEYGKKYII